MSATLNDNIAFMPTSIPRVTRVAIREVHEATFRALVATGASNAEARVAAEQVLHTELHRGSGLIALLDEVAGGSWVRTGLTCSRAASAAPTILRVTGQGRPGALRQGSLLIDLLAAESDRTAIVVSDGLTALSPLLDEPLTRAARAAGCWVVAADRSALSTHLRVAAPDGGIGVGAVTSAGSLDSDMSHVPLGVSLTFREQLPPWDITWLMDAAQRATRSAAAQHGLMVDTVVWADVKAIANAYLVPEQ